MDCGNSHCRIERLFQDVPLPEGVAISDYTALVFDSCGSRIYGQLMWPDGSYSDPRPVVILCHGFPGNARNDDVAQALCRAGCVVITPHFRGAWGSEGKYLVSNCIEDVKNLSAYARSAEFTEKYNTDPNAVFVVGHSMGGCISLNTLKQAPELAGIVMMAPFDPVHLLKSGRREFLEWVMSDAYVLHSDGVDAIIRDIEENPAVEAFSETIDRVMDRNIMMICGTRDSVSLKEDMIDPLWKLLDSDHENAIHLRKDYPVEHGLQGNRCDVIRDIAEFINICLK